MFATADLLNTEPSIPWKDIAGMRDNLAHRYFDAGHAIVKGTIDKDLDELAEAVQRLAERASRDEN